MAVRTFKKRHVSELVASVDTKEWLAIFAVLVASAFTSYVRSKVQTLNPDALISTYLFKGALVPRGLLLASWHTNILKWPLAYMQGVLPFDTATFTAANFMLLVFMLLGWAYTSALIFGRRYFYQIALVLAIIAAGSGTLSNFTLTYNVEFPLCFLAIILFWKILVRGKNSNHWLPLVAAYTILATLLMASDPYFMYAMTPALLIVLACQALKDLPKIVVPWTGLVFALLPALLSKALLSLLMAAHVFQYYGASVGSSLHQFNDLPSWTWAMIADMASLFNADSPFGKAPHLGALNGLVMFVLLALCFAAFYISIKRLPGYLKDNLPYASLVITALILLVLYVMVSGFEHQVRFLVMPELAMVTALLVWLQPLIEKLRPRQVLVLSITGIVATFCLGALTYKQAHPDLTAASQNRARLSIIVANLHSHDVNTVISSYTYTETLEFASNDSLHVVPLLDCNQNLPFWTRLSWYHIYPYTSKNVALLVDKNGRDSGSWLCSLQSVLNYYGQPLSESTMPGLDGVNVNIYYYPNSIIHKIKMDLKPGTLAPTLPE